MEDSEDLLKYLKKATFTLLLEISSGFSVNWIFKLKFFAKYLHFIIQETEF